MRFPLRVTTFLFALALALFASSVSANETEQAKQQLERRYPPPPPTKRATAPTTQLSRRGIVTASDIPAPHTDPFYLVPNNISSYKNGDVTKSRVIQAQYQIHGAGTVTQVQYRTTNSLGHPSATVASIIQPAKGGKQQMLLYNIWEDSTNRNCAPSYTILKGNSAPNIMVLGDDVPIWWAFLLMNGIAVVVPDYEGPKSALFAGFTAGYGILDSARATINHLNWAPDARISMTGYSEGAHVTCWAANLSPSYAPELNIVGTSHGGTPIDMELTLKHFDGTDMSGFALGGLHGISAAYPKFNRSIEKYGSPKLLHDLAQIYAPPVCHAILRGPNYTNTEFIPMINIPNNQSFYDWAPARYVLDRETMWNNKSSVGVGYPKFPRMIYHGRHDDVINFDAVQAYVDQQCAHGANIQFNVYEANAHTDPQLVIGGDIAAMAFTLEVMRNNGKFDKQVPCGMPTPSLLNLGIWGIDDILGGNIVAGLRTLQSQAQNAGLGKMAFGSWQSLLETVVKDALSKIIPQPIEQLIPGLNDNN